MKKEIAKIAGLLPATELLSQLAEECLELSKVLFECLSEPKGYINNAVKTNLDMLDHGWSASVADLWRNVIEEIADIQLVIDVLNYRYFSNVEYSLQQSILYAVSIVLNDEIADKRLELLEKNTFDMGKAALKLRRAIGVGNPTPITEEEAKQALICRIATMTALTDAICSKSNKKRIEEIKASKAIRWCGRLEGGQANG